MFIDLPDINGEEMHIKEKIASAEKHLDKFFQSDYYIIFIALITLTGWITGFWIYGILLMLSLTIIMMCVSSNTRPFFAFMWFFLYSMSANGAELESYGWMLIFPVLLVSSLVLNIIRFKPDFKKTLSLKTMSSLNFSILLLMVPMTLGGLGFPVRHFLAALIIFALFLAIGFGFVYFSAMAEKITDKSSVIKYVLKLMFAVGIVISVEIIINFMRQESIEAVKLMITTGNIRLGWGTPNPVASALALSFPANFYFIKHKKAGFLYIIPAIIELALIFSTNSRGIMLFTSLALPALFVYTFVKPHKKYNAIAALSVFIAVSITGFFILKDQIMDVAAHLESQGLSDSGRFDIYAEGLKLFSQYPLFGAGWDYGIGEQFVSYSPMLFHSTVIQIMACSGIIGIAFYLYFYWARYSLFLTVRTSESWIILFAMMIFEGYGMIDPVFFLPPTFFIDLLIMIFAVDLMLPAEKRKPLAVNKIRLKKS